jgi:glycosyltransferase involved in cell wall biosynthesis
MSVTVIGLKDERAELDKALWTPLPIQTYPFLGPRSLGYSPQLAAGLAATEYDAVHLHGLWTYTSVAAWQWARRTSRPYVVSPHGMLEPWALSRSAIRKRIASHLYQGRCLRGAACVHATSMMEARNIRLAGYDNLIALIPNGVELPKAISLHEPRKQNEPRRALFLSRIHPKKGLLNLVEAWHIIRPVGWELLIVGPDEDGHLERVKAAVRARALEQQISFPGEVWGEEKTRLYCGSNLFVLPSFSENFGLVIAEALSCGVPVITTRATPWQELAERGCGWWIETGVEPLVAALEEAFALPAASLSAMGARGSTLVEDRYSWGPIGQAMTRVYEWILGRRSRPDCVIDSEPRAPKSSGTSPCHPQ